MGTTTVDLVNDLLERESTTNRDEILRLARNGEFHDFKTERVTPKRDLYALLVLAELEDLALRVIEGDYDEEPDEEDLMALRKHLNGVSVMPGEMG